MNIKLGPAGGFSQPLGRPGGSPDGNSSRQPCVSARRWESGRGYLRLIITLAILTAVGYAAFQVVPAYIHNYELNDYVNSLALDVAASRMNPDEVPSSVIERAGKLNLPVELGDVKLELERSAVSIHAAYTVPIDLKVYVWPMPLSVSASAPRLVY